MVTSIRTLSVRDYELSFWTMGYSEYADREIEIVQALLEKVLDFDDAIAQACDACAELDCLLCFANATRMFNYCRPTMTEENIIKVRQGRCAYIPKNLSVFELISTRHPLQEQVVDTFVPNDILVRGGLGVGVEQNDDTSLEHDETSFMRETSVVILTGANACGKVRYGSHSAEQNAYSFRQSVYLKQVIRLVNISLVAC